MGRTAAVLVVCAVAGVVLGAQNPPRQDPPRQEPQPPRPTFRAGTNLVRVDVTVTDGEGRPVLDLAQQDFEVLEDGRPQAIESFKLLQLSGAQDAGDEESLPIRSTEHGRAEAARDEVRLFAIFFDDYHVNRQLETFRAQELLIEFIKTQLGPRDLITLMEPLTPLDALRFTRDHTELSRQIRLLNGRRGIYVPARSAAEEEQLARARNVERVRTEVTLSGLKALVTHLGSLRESRKTVLFVSGGFAVGGDMWTEFTDVLQAASQSNTAVYPIDPAFLGARSSMRLDVLRTLAEHSGGRAIINMNSFDRALAQIVRDASMYYLIGYSSLRPVADGKFREIKVRVNRKGVDVRARKGYWALTPEEAARADVASPAPPPEIARAFTALSVSRTGRPIDAWIGVSRGEAGRARVDFTWEARPARETPAGGAPALVKLTVFSADGREQFQGVAPAVPPDPARPGEPSGSVAFEVPPGSVKVKIETVSRAGEPIDMEVREIAVPDLWTPAVALGTPRVLRGRDGRHFQKLVADPNALASSGREFRRTERLLIRFAAYGKDAAPPTVVARLVTKTGAPLVTLPIVASTLPAATHQIDLPLASLAPGEYILRIEAVVGEASAVELIPLRIQ